MMRYAIAVSTSILLSTCGKAPHAFISEDLKLLVYRFVQECNARHMLCSLDQNIKIIHEDYIPECAGGGCLAKTIYDTENLTDDGSIRVLIPYQYNGHVETPDETKQVLYHELGHAFFQAVHTKTGIMRAYVYWQQEIDSNGGIDAMILDYWNTEENPQPNR